MPHGGPPGGNTRQPFFDSITSWGQARSAAISTPLGKMLTCHIPTLILAFICIPPSTSALMASVWPSGGPCSSRSNVPHATRGPAQRRGRALGTFHMFAKGLAFTALVLAFGLPLETITPQPGPTHGSHQSHPLIPNPERAHDYSIFSYPVLGRPLWLASKNLLGLIKSLCTWLFQPISAHRAWATSLPRLIYMATLLSFAANVPPSKGPTPGRGADRAKSREGNKSFQESSMEGRAWELFTSVLPAMLLVLGPTSPAAVFLALCHVGCLRTLMGGNQPQRWQIGERERLEVAASACVLRGVVWELFSQHLFFTTGHFCEFSGLQFKAGEPFCTATLQV
jgi:hypothetical protein